MWPRYNNDMEGWLAGYRTKYIYIQQHKLCCVNGIKEEVIIKYMIKEQKLNERRCRRALKGHVLSIIDNSVVQNITNEKKIVICLRTL